MYYFAYGSNMSSRRLLARTPSASMLATGKLSAHCLRFHKHSLKDRSAKCDAYHTGVNSDHIYGVIYDINAAEKPVLDRIEGLDRGYQEKNVDIELATGELLTAFTYYATRIDAALKPYSWYSAHVLAGAREHGLPTYYIQLLMQVETIEDTNRKRHDREMAIHKPG